MEPRRGNTKTLIYQQLLRTCSQKTNAKAILIVHKYSPLDATQYSLESWISAPSPGGTMTSRCPELLCLQLFFLEEDLSVHSVRAGGCRVGSGGGWGLRPRPDQLQFCVRQTILMWYSRLEEGGEGKNEANLKEFSLEIRQRVKCIKVSIMNMAISEKKMNGRGVCF